MRNFAIKRPDEKIESALKYKIDNLTKPKGSLGMLEDLALKIGMIQQTLSPELRNPNHILFGADHGIADEGVSLSPKEVTWQQMLHFLKGGAGVSFLCRQHNFKLNVIDSGVDYDFPKESGIIDMKIRKGTRNFLYGPAMTAEELAVAIDCGARVVDEVYAGGCNVVSFGEMGIGNTSPSSIWMSYLGGIPLERCIGAGSGLAGGALEHKCNVLLAAARNYENSTGVAASGYADTFDSGYVTQIMRWFGGYEMVMAVGGMLRAAELGMVILVDGFIMTACMLAACRLYPYVYHYAIFCHCGDEMGHRAMLEILHARPLLSLGLRLGEGSGAICAYPIVESAVRMINEMDSFAGADVTKYF